MSGRPALSLLALKLWCAGCTDPAERRLEALTGELGTETSEARLAAVRGLASLGGMAAPAVSLLAEALRDESPAVRTEAVSIPDAQDHHGVRRDLGACLHPFLRPRHVVSRSAPA